MTTFKRASLAAASVALAAGMASSPALAEKTIRIGHLNPESPFESHSGAMTAVFKSLVETASNGTLKVELFPNGQLGKDNEVIQQVRDGIVESCISSSGGVAQHYPLVGVFDVPFAFPNIGTVHKVMSLNSDFGEKFAGDLEAKTGLKVIGLLDSGGFFAFTNSKKPIVTAADMKGLRIRTMTLPTHETIVSSLGGQPTPLPWAEVYTALQTGVADGQMNPIPIIAFAKFDEVQKYLSITNHIITPYVWFINKDFYDGLSAEERDIVDWAAEVAVDAGRGNSRIIEASDKGLPKLAEKMEVNAVSPAELEKFAASAQPAVRKLIEEQFGAEGTEMLDAMMAEIKAANM
jgi:tripartite ATP-independent transporter DctP family solute receptor